MVQRDKRFASRSEREPLTFSGGQGNVAGERARHLVGVLTAKAYYLAVGVCCATRTDLAARSTLVSCGSVAGSRRSNLVNWATDLGVKLTRVVTATHR
jgi:hypothetical protein